MDQSSPARRPSVWGWYVAYCVAMAVWHAVLAGVGVYMCVAPYAFGNEREGNVIFGAAVAIVELPCCVAFVAGAFLPRRPWAWIAGLVLIAFGIGSCCLPLCVPLLMSWVRRSTRDDFGCK